MAVNNIGGSSPASSPTALNEQRSSGAGGSSATTERPTGAPGTSQDPGSAGDTVHISPRAVDLQALESYVGSLPEVDSNRVAEIREQLANGSYEINASAIAEKMLGFDEGL